MIRTAAWSVPAVTLAAASPAFANSTQASVTFASSDGPVLALGLLGTGTGGSLADISVLPNGPQSFTISNPGSSDLTNLTAVVAITYDQGLPLLDSKGVGVYSVDGDPARVSGRTETVRIVTPVVAATYNTTQTLTVNNIPGGSNAEVPIVFGLTDRGALGVGLLVRYNILLTLTSGGTQVGTATSSISIPVGLSIL